MSNHMTAIGFPVGSENDFVRLARQTAQSGQRMDVPGYGAYLRWSPGAGFELWAQADPRGEPVGLHPHLSGEARMRVGLLKRVIHPNNTPLDGAFYGWANPRKLEGGDYPFCFNSPDYRLHDDLTLPRVVSVQLAAFALELQAYGSKKEMQSSDGWMRHWAPESCIPSGTFLPGGNISTRQSRKSYFAAL